MQSESFADKADKTMTMPPVGTLFAHQYELIRILAEGSYGLVYEARQTLLDRRVALKVFSPQAFEDERAKKRFLSETHLLSSLEHEHIVKEFSAGISDSSHPFIVTEFLTGKTLSEIISESSGLDWESFKSIVTQIISALAFAHEKGIVHRDLKPANVMVSDNGELKLIDFGLAKIFNDENAGSLAATKTGCIVGSPAYLSPEQASNAKVDHRSDIYSLGVLMYECITGKKLFDSDSPMQVMYMHLNEPPPTLKIKKDWDIDENALDAVLQRCLQKNPENRYKSVKDLELDFQEVLRSRKSKMSLLDLSGKSKLFMLLVGLAILVCLTSFPLIIRYGPNFSSRKMLEKKLAESKLSPELELRSVPIGLARKVGTPSELLYVARKDRRSGYASASDWGIAQMHFNNALAGYARAFELLEKNPDEYLLYTAYIGRSSTFEQIIEHLDPSLNMRDRQARIDELRQKQKADLENALEHTAPHWDYERALVFRELGSVSKSMGDAKKAREFLLLAESLKAKEPRPNAGDREVLEDDVSQSMELIYHNLACYDHQNNDLEGLYKRYDKLFDYCKGNGNFGITNSESFIRLCDYPRTLFKLGKVDEAIKKAAELRSALDLCDVPETQAKDCLALGQLYKDLNMNAEAFALLEKAQKWFNANPDDERYLKDCSDLRRELQKRRS